MILDAAPALRVRQIAEPIYYFNTVASPGTLAYLLRGTIVFLLMSAMTMYAEEYRQRRLARYARSFVG